LSTVVLIAVAALGSVSFDRVALAREGSNAQFGKAHFQASCNEVAQRRF
jgi:hypothetical protein